MRNLPRYASFIELAKVNLPVSIDHLRPDDLVSFIPMSDVTEAGQWSNQQARLLREVSKGYTSFQEGDVLFAKITPCMENGKGAHAVGLVNRIGFGTTEFHVLRTNPPNNPRFVFHWLQSEALRIKAEAMMIGSAGQRRVPVDFFKSFKILLPSQEEQTRIVYVLDTIDTQIQETERLITKLKQQKVGLMHDLLTRGIDENGELRDPVAHPEQFIRNLALGRIPKEWEIITLGNAISQGNGIIQTGPFGSQLHAYEYVKEGIPVIMPQDIQDGYISEQNIARISPYKALALARHRVEPNDVIFARRGDLSRCFAINTKEVDWLCGTGCLLVRPPRGEINGAWLANMYQHHLSQQQIAVKAVGSTMVNLNTTLLAGLIIAKPSHAEQCTIVTRLNIHESRIRTEEAHLDKLKQIKKALMHDLLTGRVRVPLELQEADQVSIALPEEK